MAKLEPAAACLLVFLTQLIASAHAQNLTCYTSAAGLVAPQAWSPCGAAGSTSSSGVQSCCIPGATCGEDSLCYYPDGGANKWYVAGCTDSTYKDSVCRQACTQYLQTYVQYDQSSDLWQCCGNGGCNGSVASSTFRAVAPAKWLAEALGSSSSTIEGSSASAKAGRPTGQSTGATTTALGADSTGAASSASNNNGGLSEGAKAGIGVGVALGCVGIAGIVVAAVMRQRRRKRSANTGGGGGLSYANDEKPPAPIQERSAGGYNQRAELQGQDKHAELPHDGSQIHELPSENSWR